MRNFLSILCLLSVLDVFSQQKIVILGSSTAAGNGASTYDSSWARRLYFEYNKNTVDGLDTPITNLAMPGFVTYQVMPTDFVMPANRTSWPPDPIRNVTQALSLNPKIIIISMPSNDVNLYPDFQMTETMNNFRLMYQRITAQGVRAFITTTQPRNDISAAQKLLLRQLLDSIKNTFGANAINFWDDLVTNDGSFSLRDDRRTDQIHPNDIGHRLLFERVKTAQIFQVVNQPPVANAGVDQNVSVSSVQLSGSGSDPDGTIASYSWSKVSGPSQFTFSSASAASPVVSNLTGGTYTFRLTVTDNKGATAYDDVVIKVISSIPGRVEAESYAAMSGIQTENTADAGGGQNVGWQENNDWMDYTINVTSAGSYNVNFRVATANTGVQFQLRKADGSVLATVTAPNTGGWQTWQNVSANISLAAGQQTLRIYTTDAKGSGWNINWMDFTFSGPPVVPPVPSVSIKIEAESYTGMSGIQTENTGDAGGGMNVGWQENNDWMDYSVNLAAAGTYTVNFRVATVNTGVQFQLRKADGSVLTTVTVPNTGWWQTYQTVSATVTLPAGQQTLRIFTNDAKGSGWNFNWWEIVGTGSTPPPASTLKIEAESYSNMSGVQTENTGDAGGGLNVGWQENNDWMDYSVNVATAGTYTVNFRVATVNTGVQFQLRKADGSILTTVTVPNTGWWQTYQTVSASVTLPAGQQTLRIFTTDAKGSGWNFNWWEIAGATAAAALPVSLKIQAESFTGMSGIQTENTWDVDGGLNVGWQENNDWMDYSVNIPSAGNYTANFRVATVNAGVQFQLRKADGSVLTTVTVPNTGGWQTYQTISASVALPAGQQTLRIATTDAKVTGWNFNWWEITNIPAMQALARSTAETITTKDFGVYPNPVADLFTLEVSNGLSGKVNVQIISINGVVQKQFFINKNSPSTQTALSIGDLPKGQYILKVSMGKWTDIRKIIKL